MFQYISWRIEWYWMWEATWNGSAGFTVSHSKGSQVCFTLPTPKRLPRLQMPLQDAVRRRELHDVYDVLTCHGLLRCVVQVQSNLKQVQVRRIPASFRIQSQTRLASWLACWPHEDGGTNVDSLLFVLVLEGWACQWMSGRQRRNWDSAIALDTGYRWLQIFPAEEVMIWIKIDLPKHINGGEKMRKAMSSLSCYSCYAWWCAGAESGTNLGTVLSYGPGSGAWIWSLYVVQKQIFCVFWHLKKFGKIICENQA